MEENVPLKKIQRRLRHSRYETTANIYTHVTKRSEVKTAAKFNKFNPDYRMQNFVNNPSTVGQIK
jgi:integrase